MVVWLQSWVAGQAVAVSDMQSRQQEQIAAAWQRQRRRWGRWRQLQLQLQLDHGQDGQLSHNSGYWLVKRYFPIYTNVCALSSSTALSYSFSYPRVQLQHLCNYVCRVFSRSRARACPAIWIFILLRTSSSSSPSSSSSSFFGLWRFSTINILYATVSARPSHGHGYRNGSCWALGIERILSYFPCRLHRCMEGERLSNACKRHVYEWIAAPCPCPCPGHVLQWQLANDL